MTTSRRLIWLLTLCLFTTGCTTYRQAVLPTPTPPPPAPADSAFETVRAGMTVRLHLRSGEELTSEVTRVTPDAIVIGKPSNYGWQERTIPAADILWLEVEQATLVGDILVSFVGTTILITTAAVVLLAIAVSQSDFSGLD